MDFSAVIAMVLLVLPHLVGWLSLCEAQWRSTRLSALSPLHPSGSDGSHRRPSDGVSHRHAGGDIPRVCASAEGDFGLSVPAAARRRVDCGSQPGLAGSEPGRPAT